MMLRHRVIENVALPKSLILVKFLAQIFCFTINIQLTPIYGMLCSRTYAEFIHLLCEFIFTTSSILLLMADVLTNTATIKEKEDK